MRGLALGLAALAGALASGAAADAWQPLAPAGAGFSAQVPATPEYERSSNLTLAGRIVKHRYSLHADGVRIWITWTELPRIALWFAARKGIFENVRSDFVGRSEVSELSFEPVELGAHRGRELRYREELATGPAGGRLRAFLVDRRLFVFNALTRTEAGEGAVGRFFESLQLDPGAH